MNAETQEILSYMNLFDLPIRIDEILNWTQEEKDQKLVEYRERNYRINNDRINEKVDEYERDVNAIIEDNEECFRRLIEFHNRSGRLIQYIYETSICYNMLYEARHRVNTIFNRYQDSALKVGTWKEAEDIERFILQ
jgi:hypothetical protein